jgi:hypothetical protein
MADFVPGDRVHYVPTKENGIVKTVRSTETYLGTFPFWYGQRVDVVYHCNNNWAEYHLYPAISTRVDNLKKGWIPGKTRTD